jgi:hypothetical protein
MSTKLEELESIVIGTAQPLQALIATLAESAGAERADHGGLLATQGLEAFETRGQSESPAGLLSGFEKQLDQFDNGAKSMWPIRVTRHTAIRLKLTAKEYSVPVSRLVASLIAAALPQQEPVA